MVKQREMKADPLEPERHRCARVEVLATTRGTEDPP